MLVDYFLPALRKQRKAALATSVALVASAFALRAFTPVSLAFVTFYPAVLLSTFAGGRWIGLLATILSAALAWYFFLPPENSFELSFQQAINLTAFVAVSLILVVTGDALATALERSESNRRRHEELLREMAHRLKNQYAVLSAVARGISKDAENFQDFDLLFGEKMRGLASSHDLLMHGKWEGATIKEVVHAHMKPFCRRDRYDMEGDTVVLDANSVQYLGIAFHELCTNALKHGALATVKGKIKVSWALQGADLVIKWTENSPKTAAVPPELAGFGSKLLAVIVPAAVSGTSLIEYFPVGLQWSLTMPATQLAAHSGSNSY